MEPEDRPETGSRIASEHLETIAGGFDEPPPPDPGDPQPWWRVLQDWFNNLTN